ncbi:VOC family protein [Rhodoferax sp.]|uniref:VOC family protein n=1 Tax=Rhodoferax sp. TaxID=50421 RepID=UPI0025DCCA47|nr:VOC family protein [Rhodoferax sp.]
MAKIIHSMVRVLHLDASLKFYADCFGLQPAHRLDFPSFSLVYLRNAENDAEIELTWNRDRTEPYTHGDGYGHVGVCVPDAVADRARLLELGYSPLDIKEFKADDGTLIARYFFIQDPDGYKVEVLERHGHYQ